MKFTLTSSEIKDIVESHMKTKFQVKADKVLFKSGTSLLSDLTIIIEGNQEIDPTKKYIISRGDKYEPIEDRQQQVEEILSKVVIPPWATNTIYCGTCGGTGRHADNGGIGTQQCGVCSGNGTIPSPM